MIFARERAQRILQRAYMNGVTAEGIANTVEYGRNEIQLYGIDMAFLGVSVTIAACATFVLIAFFAHRLP